MAKKDLRAQMDAARAAAAFIGAAQEVQGRDPEEGGAPEPPANEAAPKGETALPEGEAGRAGTPGDGGSESGSPAAGRGDSVPELMGAGGLAVELERAPSVSMAVVKMPADDPATAMAPEEPAPAAPSVPSAGTAPKPKRARKPRKKPAPEAPEAAEAGGNRMTAQVLVTMTAEQREHADLLAQVMKVTRAEVMRQALDEYWDNHKSELQAAVAAYEQLIRKLMK